MKPASCKAKGRKLQDEIREAILETFPELDPADVKTAIMGESGKDIQLSAAAQKVFPYGVEAKNTEKLSIWSAWRQACANAGTLKPCVIFRRNHSETLAVIRLSDLLALLEKTKWSE